MSLKEKPMKAIFFDIDGTLRDFHSSRIPKSAKDAIAAAKEAGLKVFIATGRHRLEMEEENLLEGLEFDGYVTLNGQYCYSGKDDFVFHKCPLEKDQIRILIQMIRERDFSCMFMEADRMYMNKISELVIRAQEGIGTALPPLENIERALDHDIFQAVPYVGREEEQWMISRLEHCESTRWHDECACDITPAGRSKMDGIQAALKFFDITAEETAAIGDGKNDVTMISMAGLGIAMGNGCKEAKEAADFVTAPLVQDGLSEAVFKIINHYL